MKKLIIPVLALLTLASCAKFDEMNKSTTGLSLQSGKVSMIFGRTLYNGSSNDHQRNFNLNDDMYAHYFADGLGWTDYWRYNAGWGDIFWRDFYTDRLQEYWLIDELCTDRPEYTCVKACNDIWNVVLFLRVIDRQGDAPYFDENGKFAAGKGSTLPYSKVADIYADLIKRLQNDVTLLDTTSEQVTFGKYDFLFNSDWKQWKKFANTIIMRLAMRYGKAETFKDAFLAAANGCFDNPKDYARISCDTGVWGDYYDRTFNDWANTFTNCDLLTMMNGTNKGYTTGVVDPRRAFFFQEGSRPSWAEYLAGIQKQIDDEKAKDDPNAEKIEKLEKKLAELKEKDGYEGTTWDGYPFDYTSDKEEGLVAIHGGTGSYAKLNMYDVNGLFHYSGAGNENLSWCYSSYSETLFLKAEAALRGWGVSGSAEDLFKQAIKASMDEIGVFVTRSGGKNTIAAAEQDAYIAALPAFGASKEEQLRSIMIQKWIALYPNSVEAWAEQRRTGYPDYASKVFTYPAVSSSSGVSVGNIIQRIPYPQNEYNTNASNIPSEFSDYSAKNMEKGISWSLNGAGATQSATAAPKNF